MKAGQLGGTSWIAHLQKLADGLRAVGHDPVVLRGGMGGKDRAAALAQLRPEPGGPPLLVVATGPYAGEGFDCPPLDTLFLAAPVSYKGKLVQYAGRILRPYDGKTTAEVHDYAGERTRVLASSRQARTRLHQPGLSRSAADLGFAEAIAFPLLAILAFFIFRGIAALLPITVGGMAVLVTFLVLRLINMALPLSIFALNLVIGLGLGLAVDYSLFLVWRFRDEMRQDPSTERALRVTLATTGRTVMFSAATVAVALATLTVFPQRFLVSMGLGGAVVALVAAASGLLIVPPLLVLLSRRISRARPPRPDGGWYRLANGVMRHPVLIAVGTAVLLLAIASPALGVRWSGIDATVLPTSQSARVVSDTVASQFPPSSDSNAILVVASAPAPARPALGSYADQLARLPGMAQASGPVQLAPGTWEIRLIGPADPISAASQRAVREVRALPAPVPVLVGGSAADFADQGAAIAGTLPLAIAILVIVTVLVLWLMTGSVILPIKTQLMNALTAVAATGILVLIFQDGRLAGLLSYTSQGGIEETDFLILVALAFAVSTDYGVFLLARISEARRPSVTEREAIAVGMQRTGRLITSASILLAVAIGVFATSKLVFLQEVGVGVAAAVLIDAFIVRALLVPSLMALLGRWNWWAPAPLARLHRRLGLGEAQSPVTRSDAGGRAGAATRPEGPR